MKSLGSSGPEAPRLGRPKPERLWVVLDEEEPTADIPIGVIVPFDFGVDWQYWQYVPQGVSLHFTRTPYLRKSVGIELARDVSRASVVKKATRTLNALDTHVVAYACSSGSFVNGVAGEVGLRQAMLDAGARRAVTTSRAMLDALFACGVENVALASPYTARVATKLADFVEEAGLEVASNVHLGMSRGIAQVNRKTIAELVRRAARPPAEAVFLSCTGLRTLGIVAALEEEVGLPILTSNQVTLWDALRQADALPSEPLDGESPVLGDANPMARSTLLLLRAAAEESREEAG
jgi:maleate isomerase